MLIFIFCVIIAIVGIGVTIYLDDNFMDSWAVPVEVFSGLIGIISGIVSIIMVFIMISNVATEVPSYCEKMEEYKNIEFKIDNLYAYTDNLELNKASVIEEATEWNENVTYYSKITRSPLCGALYCNYWENLPTFDLNELEENLQRPMPDWGIQ